MRAGTMLVAVMAFALGSSVAVAQQSQPEVQQQPPEQQAQGQDQKPKSLPDIPAGADRVVGKAVMGQKGQQVGEVSDVLVGKDGKVAGLIMEHGGTLGIGGSNVIVPWDQMSIQGDQLSLKMTDQEVSNLPSID